MSLPAQEVSEVSDLIISQLEAKFGQTIPILPKAFARVLAKILAGVFILIWKYAGFQFLQLFVAHATMDETVVNGKTIRPLVEWGRLIGVGDPLAATRAEHVIAVTVTNQTGSLDAGKKLVRAETGVVYEVAAAVLLNAPTVQVQVRAISDQQGGNGSGAIGNLAPGDVLSFANTPPNVATDATVVSTTVVGADAETPDAYRAKIVRRVQAKPQGGAYADYREWGETVEGVAHIYPYTGKLPGEVDVYVECSTDIDADGIPDQALLDQVLAAIELPVAGLPSRRPANAAVNTLPITRTAFDVVVQGLDVPDPVATENDIFDGIDEYLRSREPFIVGLSVLPRVDRITAAAISGIVDEIVDAAGGSVVSVTLAHTFTARSLNNGEKAKARTVNFEA
jgi:hypothetical protein